MCSPFLTNRLHFFSTLFFNAFFQRFFSTLFFVFFVFYFSFLSFLTQISGIRLFIKTYTACHVYTVTPFASTLPHSHFYSITMSDTYSSSEPLFFLT